MKCPICGFPLDNKTYHDEVSLVEEYYVCKRCYLYQYTYEYGIVAQKIGNKCFLDDRRHELHILWTRLKWKVRNK